MTHLSGSRDLATGRLRAGQWMTDAQGEALVYLASLSAPVLSVRVGGDLAPDRAVLTYTANASRGYAMLRSLQRFGLAARAGRNAWEITERGRIAAVLFLARRPGMAEAFFEDEWSANS